MPKPGSKVGTAGAAETFCFFSVWGSKALGVYYKTAAEPPEPFSHDHTQNKTISTIAQ